MAAISSSKMKWSESKRTEYKRIERTVQQQQKLFPLFFQLCRAASKWPWNLSFFLSLKEPSFTSLSFVPPCFGVRKNWLFVPTKVVLAKSNLKLSNMVERERKFGKSSNQFSGCSSTGWKDWGKKRWKGKGKSPTKWKSIKVITLFLFFPSYYHH